ncbi:MAG: hypothetical protein HUK40_00610 [Desulfobacter sp.]|nr:hypothetical protein [Desulfobacter sp.]
MKFLLPAIGSLIILSLVGGCVSTETDPRKGGLFSYNPKAYEKRIDDRKSTLETTEADTAQAKQEGQALELTQQEKQAQHEAMKTKLAVLYNESGKLQKELEQTKAANAQQEKELKRLLEEVGNFRNHTIKTNNSKTSDAAKQAKIAQLQQRMDELLKEAEALSAL